VVSQQAFRQLDQMPCIMQAGGHCRLDRLADNSSDSPKAKSCWKVQIKHKVFGSGDVCSWEDARYN